MLHLKNRELTVELLDPATEAARQGARYCWGGYIWQVHDTHFGPLLSGPEFPHPTPSAFNGQGLPESFRHRTRSGTPLTWAGATGLVLGGGRLALDEKNIVTLTEPCVWQVHTFADHLVFQTTQTGAGFAYELSREITLRHREIISSTQLTNVGSTTLALEWFAHPFWALSAGRARLALPAGTTIPENPAFSLAPNGTLHCPHPFLSPEDSPFTLLTLPRGRPLALTIDHPQLDHITFETSFVPDECPIWANARTLSVEPYRTLRLAPGQSSHWHLRHGFHAPLRK